MFPDENIDLRPSGIEAQLRAQFERILPGEVGRIVRRIAKHPNAQRVKIRFSWRLHGGALFDYEISDEVK